MFGPCARHQQAVVGLDVSPTLVYADSRNLAEGAAISGSARVRTFYVNLAENAPLGWGARFREDSEPVALLQQTAMQSPGFSRARAPAPHLISSLADAQEQAVLGGDAGGGDVRYRGVYGFA